MALGDWLEGPPGISGTDLNLARRCFKQRVSSLGASTTADVESVDSAGNADSDSDGYNGAGPPQASPALSNIAPPASAPLSAPLLPPGLPLPKDYKLGADPDYKPRALGAPPGAWLCSPPVLTVAPPPSPPVLPPLAPRFPLSLPDASQRVPPASMLHGAVKRSGSIDQDITQVLALMRWNTDVGVLIPPLPPAGCYGHLRVAATLKEASGPEMEVSASTSAVYGLTPLKVTHLGPAPPPGQFNRTEPLKVTISDTATLRSIRPVAL